MNKLEMEKIIGIFWKWFDKHCDEYTNEEAKLREYYGINKTGSNRLVSFYAGYKIAKKENEKAITNKVWKNGLTCGIAYSIGLLKTNYHEGAAECLLKESGIKSKSELRAAGCEQFDIDNIGDLLPENTK
jgi:hypothetical protein